MHLWNNPIKPPSGAPIAAFDYDETLGRGVLHWKFHPHLARLGVLPDPHEDEELREALVRRRRRDQSYKHYEDRFIQLARQRYADVKISRAQLAEHAKAFVKAPEILEEQYAFPRALFQVLREQGYALVLISWAPLELLHPLAEIMGFHHAVGNIMESDEAGFFTGREGRLPVKENEIVLLVKEHGYTLDGSLAVGDSGTDLGMLKMVSTGVAFNPKPGLRKTLDTDMSCASILRVVERAEVITFTQNILNADSSTSRLEEVSLERALPKSLAVPLRSRLESIGYYLWLDGKSGV